MCRCRLCILDSHIAPDDLYIYVEFTHSIWFGSNPLVCIKPRNRRPLVWVGYVVKSVWHYHCTCRPEFSSNAWCMCAICSCERLLSITVGWQLSPSGAPRPSASAAPPLHYKKARQDSFFEGCLSNCLCWLYVILAALNVVVVVGAVCLVIGFNEVHCITRIRHVRPFSGHVFVKSCNSYLKGCAGCYCKV